MTHLLSLFFMDFCHLQHCISPCISVLLIFMMILIYMIISIQMALVIIKMKNMIHIYAVCWDDKLGIQRQPTYFIFQDQIWIDPQPFSLQDHLFLFSSSLSSFFLKLTYGLIHNCSSILAFSALQIFTASELQYNDHEINLYLSIYCSFRPHCGF